MDAERWKKLAGGWITRDRAVKLAVLLGICGVALIYLSSLPGGTGETRKEPPAAQSETADRDYARRLEEELSRIVTAITGEANPEVLVTLEGGERTVYGLDERTTDREDQTQRESSHVLLKSADGGQEALEISRLEPQIRGVVIVSRRGNDPVIRERLIQAVRTALRLSSARVCVTAGNEGS